MENKKERPGISGLIVSAVIGGFSAIALTLILLLIFSLLIAHGALPESIEVELIITTALVSSIIGALITSKRMKTSPLPSGLCGGACYLLIILLISALRPSGALFGVMTIKLAICALSGSAFGGMLGSKQKSRKRAHKRHNRG